MSCAGITTPYTITTNNSCSDPVRCTTPQEYGDKETRYHRCVWGVGVCWGGGMAGGRVCVCAGICVRVCAGVSVAMQQGLLHFRYFGPPLDVGKRQGVVFHIGTRAKSDEVCSVSIRD
jgi:hypothetical protein